MSLQPLRGALAAWKPVGGAIEPLHAISAAWPAIVGLDIAANCAPISLANGTLTIATRSSAWSQQLQFLSLSIVSGIGEHAGGTTVRRLAFRVGAFRGGERRSPGAAMKKAAARRRGDAAGYEPAIDLADAFDRVRARIRDARRASPAACSRCGAPLGPEPNAGRCTPCALATASEATLHLERLIYAAPWLTFEDVREQLPRLSVVDYERSRRRLLGRWWLVLERARKAGVVGKHGLERSIASSYVLLQTRLSPDRVTPEVVSNALGADLAAILFGDRAAQAPAQKARESAWGTARRR
jgi:hypothetical protein